MTLYTAAFTRCTLRIRFDDSRLAVYAVNLVKYKTEYFSTGNVLPNFSNLHVQLSIVRFLLVCFVLNGNGGHNLCTAHESALSACELGLLLGTGLPQPE